MTKQISALERLAALHEIGLLKARRDRAADTKDWALNESLHAPDGRSTAHHSHTPEITFETSTRAKGIWGMEDMIFEAETKELLIHGFGFYQEVYEKRDGAWLFTSRQLKRTHVRTSPSLEPE